MGVLSFEVLCTGVLFPSGFVHGGFVHWRFYPLGFLSI